MSARAAEIFGLLPGSGELHSIALDWLDNIAVVNSSDAEATRGRFLDLIEGGAGSYDAIFPYRRPLDGRVVWIHSYATVARDSTRPMMYGVAQDVTEYILV